MSQPSRDQDGVFKLAGIIASMKLPSSALFLRAAGLSAQERAALERAASEFDRPTSLEVYRAVGAYLRTHSRAEVQELNDIGNRIVPSEAQQRAIRSWPQAFRHINEFPATLRSEKVKTLVSEFLHFSEELTRCALSADEEEGVDDSEATYVELANIALWRRLRRTLATIQLELGDKWMEFVTSSQRTAPRDAPYLLSFGDLEESV
jgi:hypothetical protein